MPLLNILVAFNGSDASVSALDYAAARADAVGGHVTALLAHAKHEVIDRHSKWIPAEARALLARANDDVLSRIEARFEDRRAALDLGDRLHFVREAGRVDVVLSEQARCYDLIVVGRSSDADEDQVALHPDRIALLSGKPVMVIPEGHVAGAGHSHAALAWDGGRSAARALSDSLRLLEDEGKVTVLTVGEAATARPIAALVDHLARHRVEAVHEAFPKGAPIARTILDFCKSRDPGFLVMGAYEHSKFREDLLGGVTAEVLREIRIPVLLSH